MSDLSSIQRVRIRAVLLAQENDLGTGLGRDIEYADEECESTNQAFHGVPPGLKNNRSNESESRLI